MPAVKALVALLLLAALGTGCANDDGDSESSTATPPPTTGGEVTATATTPAETATAAPTSTARPTASPEAPHRTGDAFIDRVIEAVETRDITALRSMVRLQETECVSIVEGLGGPPPCNPDEPEGSTVAVFPVAACEGTFTRHPGATLGSFVSAARGLYAVTESSGEPRSVPYWPIGDAYVVFHVDRAGSDPGQRLVLEDGAIVAVWFGCGPIEDALFWRGEPLTLIAGPFDKRAPAPPPPPVSGIEGVDEVIVAVTNYDLTALQAHTALTAVPCVDRARDASEVTCETGKGEVPGDVIGVLPTFLCVGELTRDAIAAYTELLDLQPAIYALQESLGRGQGDRWWVNGTYHLTLELSAPTEKRQAAQLVLDDEGRIVVLRFNCGQSAEELLKRGGAAIPLTAEPPTNPTPAAGCVRNEGPRRGVGSPG